MCFCMCYEYDRCVYGGVYVYAGVCICALVH